MRQSASADAYAAVTGRTAGDKLENVVPHSGLIIRSSIDFDIRLIPPRGPCQRGFCKEFIPVEWIPKEPTLDAYKKLFAMPEFVGSIFNSFYVSVLCTAVRLLCAAMAAFALTKIPFKGRNAVFGIYVTALMIPSQITFIPLFIIMTNMHLTNSLNAFMLLQLFNAFAIFMMRQKMMTINDAYIEAAVIDGASMWRIFFKIILPMSGSAMATLAILAFMDMWNDYLLPLVLLSERSKFTLPLLLSTLSGQYKNQYNLTMAGALIVYIFAQKYFKEGLTVGGVKG